MVPGFGAYLQAAFLNRWNLLVLGGAGAAALISGRADVFLPLVAAAEIAFLAAAASSERFQRAVNARTGALAAAKYAQTSQQIFDRLYYGLPFLAQKEFDDLRARCEVLRDLAGSDAAARGLGFDQVAREQLLGVNKLLWVYLKLLHTKHLLAKFFESTDESEMRRLAEDAKRRLSELPVGSPDPLVEKKRKSVEDTLRTVGERQANFLRAKEKSEFVSLELDRISAKLAGIAELAINRQDTELLTHDVDDVARSVQATEAAMTEIEAFAGASGAEAEVPAILAPQAQRTRSQG